MPVIITKKMKTNKKEMDYEKKYKEALGWMQSLYNGLHGKTKEEAEKYFPELQESEDERIRKRLIEFFEDWGETKSHCWGKSVNKILAWLEKQKSVGEIVERCKNSWYNEGKIAGMLEGLTDDEKYQQGWHDALEKQGKKKAIMNVPSREVILSIWDLGNEWKELTNGSISTEYGTQLDYIQKHWHESEYFLREKQGERKPTWSEDDENVLEDIEEAIINYWHGDTKIFLLDWLKSLKERLKNE